MFYDAAENHGSDGTMVARVTEDWACQSAALYFLNNPLSHINIKINISTLFMAHNVLCAPPPSVIT